MPYFCEMCGRMVNEPLISISHYGERLSVCRQCFEEQKKKNLQKQVEPQPKAKTTKPSQNVWEPQYEVIDECAKAVKGAREKAGLSIQQLAMKLGIKESVLRRIEAGKLQPDLETARKLERFLRIQLVFKREGTQAIKVAGQGGAGLELRHVAKLKDAD